MTLEPTFSLTPRKSHSFVSENHWANLIIQGAFFYPNYSPSYGLSFSHQYQDDELYFFSQTAGDPNLDYNIWANRFSVPCIYLNYDLRDFGEYKDLALVFGFDAFTPSRVLVYTWLGFLEDVELVPGDNQFLIEVGSVERFELRFIHSQRASTANGGHWVFKGITGYVI